MPKRTPAEFRYRRLIEEQSCSGMNASSFARSVGIRPNTFAWWRSEIRRRDALREEPPSPQPTTAPPFLPVRVHRTAPTSQAGCRFPFELQLPGGTCLRVAPTFDAEDLHRPLAVVSENSFAFVSSTGDVIVPTGNQNS